MPQDWLNAGWKFLIVRGVVAIVFGIVAISWPQSTAIAFALLWGVWALADGLGSLLQAFSPDSVGTPRWLLVVMGVIALLAGFFAVTSPAMTAVTLTWILGIWLLVRGAFELMAAFGSTTAVPRGLLYLGAALDLLLGVLFVANPGRGVIGIAVLLGLTAVAWGVVFVAVGFWVRREAKALTTA